MQFKYRTFPSLPKISSCPFPVTASPSPVLKLTLFWFLAPHVGFLVLEPHVSITIYMCSLVPGFNVFIFLHIFIPTWFLYIEDPKIHTHTHTHTHTPKLLELTNTSSKDRKSTHKNQWISKSKFILCSNVTHSERLPLSILSKMILRFSIVFYCNLVFLSQVLEIWRSSQWGWYGTPGWEGNKLFLFHLLLCFVSLPISRLSLNPSVDWLSPKIVWFPLYKMSRIGKFVETESRLELAWGWGVWSLDGKGQLMDIGFL